MLTDVVALVSKISNLRIETRDDLKKVIIAIGIANSCVRLFINEIESETIREQLLTQSSTIDKSIETVRSKAERL